MSLQGVLAYSLRALRFGLLVAAAWIPLRWVRLYARTQRTNLRREGWLLVFVFYLAALKEIIALRGGALGGHPPVQWILLKTTLSQWRVGAWTFLYHTGGNLLWFLPLGWLARKLWPGLRPVHVLLLGAGCSLGLEAAQWLLGTGVPDVDDVLLNAMGAWIGGVLRRKAVHAQN